MWPNRVTSRSRRNDECFGVMDHQWRKFPNRALHNRFLALAQIQNIDAAIRAMRYGPRKPVPARLDELAFVQASSFFPPALSFGDWSYGVNQLFLHPCGGAFPLNASNAVLQVDWTR